MEIQVENHGSDVDLKLDLIWFLFSRVGFRIGYQLFIFKGNAYMYIHFLNHKLFEKSLHICPYCFSIAKGLATCRLGGVISTQKVLF